jgi:hypothetical protein
MSTSATAAGTRIRKAGLDSFHLGERVVGHDRHGIVVGMIDTSEYAAPFRPHTWDALATGVLVRLDDGMLIHYREPWVSLRRPA